jgi:hypothetical protein
MLYMNEFDIDVARRRFTRANCPNRLALVMVVEHLKDWTGDHGDGWAHWTAPRQAAVKAMKLIQSTTNEQNRLQETHDISDAEVQAAVRPIKAFLTRQKASPEQRELIFRSVS